MLVAHGGRDPAWAASVEALRAHLAARLGEGRVRVGYLELCRPSLSEALAAVLAAGVRSVVLLPLLLSGGRHLRRDVPAAVEAAVRTARAAGSDLAVRVLPPLLESRPVVDAVRMAAEAAMLPLFEDP